MTEHVTDENQLGGDRLYQHEDCGLACALSLALDAGLDAGDTIGKMEQWYTDHGDSPADGTGIAVNQQFLQHLGLNCTAAAGGLDAIDGFLASGYRIQLAIYSNGYGTPYSGPNCFGHFIELCWRTPTGYHVMQPVGGLEVEYTRDQIAQNSQGSMVVVQHDYRNASLTPVIGTSSGGNKFMDPQTAAAFVDLAYEILALRKTLEAHGMEVPNFNVDAVDPNDFNNQVQAILTGKQDVHAIVNAVSRAQ